MTWETIILGDFAPPTADTQAGLLAIVDQAFGRGGAQTGQGDTLQSFFFSPASPAKKLVIDLVPAIREVLLGHRYVSADVNEAS